MSITALLMVFSIHSMAEQVLQIPGPEGPLQGTLVSGAEPSAPMVLIIPGSGPTNRDGNSPLGIRAAPYRLLAQELAARDIHSVRIDKRGMFGSRAAITDPDQVRMQDYAYDVGAWVEYLADRGSQRCIWLLGHSEGGLVALQTAQHSTRLCGLILVATPGRPLASVLRDQLESNPANQPLMPEALNIISALEQGKTVAEVSAPLEPLFRPQVQGYLISIFQVDPVQLIKNVNGPVLILQGTDDLQVHTEDARALSKAKPDAIVKVLPRVNHVLKEVPEGDTQANLRSYAQRDLPLAQGVVEAIVAVVKP
ncbi:Alpha/beta hydrolase family protein [compost metagenome]